MELWNDGKKAKRVELKEQGAIKRGVSSWPVEVSQADAEKNIAAQLPEKGKQHSVGKPAELLHWFKSLSSGQLLHKDKKPSAIHNKKGMAD